MCDSVSQQLLADVVKEKTGADELFTAFDVSLEVRRRGGSERHRNMKNEIHREVTQYVDAGLYQRELWDVGTDGSGQSLRAFLYYPTGADPKTYQAVTRRDAKQPATPAGTALLNGLRLIPATAGATPDPNDADDGDQVDAVGRISDQRGSISTPSYLLRAAGINCGDIAYVMTRTDSQGRQCLAIATRVPSGFAPLTTYRVDEHNNVRITKATISAGGLNPTGGFDFERVDNQVLVRQH